MKICRSLHGPFVSLVLNRRKSYIFVYDDLAEPFISIDVIELMKCSRFPVSISRLNCFCQYCLLSFDSGLLYFVARCDEKSYFVVMNLSIGVVESVISLGNRIVTLFELLGSDCVIFRSTEEVFILKISVENLNFRQSVDFLKSSVADVNSYLPLTIKIYLDGCTDYNLKHFMQLESILLKRYSSRQKIILYKASLCLAFLKSSQQQNVVSLWSVYLDFLNSMEKSSHELYPVHNRNVDSLFLLSMV